MKRTRGSWAWLAIPASMMVVGLAMTAVQAQRDTGKRIVFPKDSLKRGATLYYRPPLAESLVWSIGGPGPVAAAIIGPVHRDSAIATVMMSNAARTCPVDNVSGSRSVCLDWIVTCHASLVIRGIRDTLDLVFPRCPGSYEDPLGVIVEALVLQIGRDYAGEPGKPAGKWGIPRWKGP